MHLLCVVIFPTSNAFKRILINNCLFVRFIDKNQKKKLIVVVE